MPDEPLTNAAVELMRRTHGFLNEISEPPSIAPADHYVEDFVRSDRRKGGVNFGELDASDHVRTLQQYWEFGGRPHFSILEVVGVRGEWSAAYVERVVYGGSDMHVEHIYVVARDPSRDKWRQFLVFDPDDVEAAIDELDRIHTETVNARGTLP